MGAKKKIKYVIVRSHTAGVHFGEFVSRRGDTVILKNSIRLWQWSGASLSQVASIGPANGINKFGMVVQETEIVSPQGFEIATCTTIAAKAIIGLKSWVI